MSVCVCVDGWYAVNRSFEGGIRACTATAAGHRPDAREFERWWWEVRQDGHVIVTIFVTKTGTKV